MPWIALHEALSGQPPASADGVQISAQFVGDGEPCDSSTHFGVAVVPAGTSVGHAVDAPQFGEQKEPASPVIWMAFSSGRQSPAFGSS